MTNEYKVKEGKGIITKGRKSYFAGDVIELNDKEAERLKDKVEALEVKKVEQKADKAEDLSELKFEELKKLVEADESLEVKPTGKNGAVTKEDLITALESKK